MKTDCCFEIVALEKKVYLKGLPQMYTSFLDSPIQKTLWCLSFSVVSTLIYVYTNFQITLQHVALATTCCSQLKLVTRTTSGQFFFKVGSCIVVSRPRKKEMVPFLYIQGLSKNLKLHIFEGQSLYLKIVYEAQHKQSPDVLR